MSMKISKEPLDLVHVFGEPMETDFSLSLCWSGGDSFAIDGIVTHPTCCRMLEAVGADKSSAQLLLNAFEH